jgi:hypothetical protein
MFFVIFGTGTEEVDLGLVHPQECEVFNKN